jgi:predicted Fe-S protein YdhL (DUF1289 family)
MSNESTETVLSPCVGICCPDENDVCMGCLRTMQEVTQWWEMSNDEKRALLNMLPTRRK